MKDTTYLVLAQECLKKQPPKSMGKFLNEILDREAEKIRLGEAGGLPANAGICVVCGGKAVLQQFGFGQQSLQVCSRHKIKELGFKEIQRQT